MKKRERYWRRLTRAAWLLLAPSVLGCVLGADGIWAAGLCALGPGMGRGAARAREGRDSQTLGALAEGLASAVLASLVAAVSALVGWASVATVVVLVTWRALGWLVGRKGFEQPREFRLTNQLGRLTCWNPAAGA